MMKFLRRLIRPYGLEDFEYQVRKLRLQPGDGLVLTVPKSITDRQAAQFKEQLEQVAEKLRAPHTQVLVLTDGMDISVISASSLAGVPPPATNV